MFFCLPQNEVVWKRKIVEVMMAHSVTPVVVDCLRRIARAGVLRKEEKRTQKAFAKQSAAVSSPSVKTWQKVRVVTMLL